MLFDTHAHMVDPVYDEDREELVASLPEKGVGLVLNPGCCLETSRMAVDLANRFSHVYAAVGCHPDSAGEVCPETLEEFRKLCRENPKVKAIGEIGLDYYYEDIPREVQKKAFRDQLALAAELDLPVIIHDREAHADCLEILKDFPRVRGVFHCYSGSAEMARQLSAKGWYIGFTGVLTFKNARKAVESARIIPMDRIVIETDCPFMSPEPFRGKRNDPSRLYRMAQTLAQIRDISEEEAQRVTFENGKRLYRIED